MKHIKKNSSKYVKIQNKLLSQVRDVHACCVFMDAFCSISLLSVHMCVRRCVFFMHVRCFLMCVLFYFSFIWLLVCTFVFKSMVHCGVAFEPDASGLPYSCTPLVSAPIAIVLYGDKTKKKKEGKKKRPIARLNSRCVIWVHSVGDSEKTSSFVPDLEIVYKSTKSYSTKDGLLSYAKISSTCRLSSRKVANSWKAMQGADGK